MKLKRLLKRYDKTRKKATKMYEEIINAYEEAYLINDVQTTEEIFNALWDTNIQTRMKRMLLNSHYGLTNYADTDSVIYKDFNKKSEV